jgi:hypothetical protein
MFELPLRTQLLSISKSRPSWAARMPVPPPSVSCLSDCNAFILFRAPHACVGSILLLALTLREVAGLFR